MVSLKSLKLLKYPDVWAPSHSKENKIFASGALAEMPKSPTLDCNVQPGWRTPVLEGVFLTSIAKA